VFLKSSFPGLIKLGSCVVLESVKHRVASSVEAALSSNVRARSAASTVTLVRARDAAVGVRVVWTVLGGRVWGRVVDVAVGSVVDAAVARHCVRGLAAQPRWLAGQALRPRLARYCVCEICRVCVLLCVMPVVV
jgi:hypothetical protein